MIYTKKHITPFITTSILASILLGSCSEMFENRIGLNPTKSNASLTSLVIPEAKIDHLNAPAQIFVSQSEYPDRIRVTWSPVEYATSYCLERAVCKSKDVNGNFIPPQEDDFKVIPLASKIYSTQYEDIILTSPTYSDEEYNYAYLYRVRAENPRLKFESSEYKHSEYGSLLAPVPVIQATLGEFTDRIILSWEKSAGAKSYEIFRSLNSDGSSAVPVGNVSSNETSFTNTISTTEQGKEFYYTVKTITSSNTSVSSAIALGYTLQEGAPPKIANVQVTNGRGNDPKKISISWTKVDDPEVLYSVYRTSSKDPSYTLLKQGLKNTVETLDDTKSLKPNIYYYYQVQAYKEKDGVKIKGPFSASSRTDAAPAEGFILGPSQDLSVEKKADGTCSLKITAALGSKDCIYDSKTYTEGYNKYSYKVYFSETANGTYITMDTFKFDDTELTLDENGFYTLNGIQSARFFKVTTVFNDSESDLSSACAPAPFAARNVTVSKNAFIAGYTDEDNKANKQGVFPVKITWDPPEENDADGGYYIYRSSSKTSGFTKITETPVTDTVYYDINETGKAGIYYYYKVLSLNILGQGAYYTEPADGYGSLTAEQYMREYNKTVMNSQKKLTLMHMSDDMKKLGSETAKGKTGSLSYSAGLAGLGARILMHYTNYADYYIMDDESLGWYFFINGDTNTTASMDASGSMDGTVTCAGMYPGKVIYDKVQIKGGSAGGGTYGIMRDGFNNRIEVNYKVGEEGR